LEKSSNQACTLKQRIAFLFFSNKPETLKNIPTTDLDEIENSTKCEVLRTSQQTFSFVDWLVSALNIVVAE